MVFILRFLLTILLEFEDGDQVQFGYPENLYTRLISRLLSSLGAAQIVSNLDVLTISE